MGGEEMNTLISSFSDNLLQTKQCKYIFWLLNMCFLLLRFQQAELIDWSMSIHIDQENFDFILIKCFW